MCVYVFSTECPLTVRLVKERIALYKDGTSRVDTTFTIHADSKITNINILYPNTFYIHSSRFKGSKVPVGHRFANVSTFANSDSIPNCAPAVEKIGGKVGKRLGLPMAWKPPKALEQNVGRDARMPVWRNEDSFFDTHVGVISPQVELEEWALLPKLGLGAGQPGAFAQNLLRELKSTIFTLNYAGGLEKETPYVLRLHFIPMGSLKIVKKGNDNTPDERGFLVQSPQLVYDDFLASLEEQRGNEDASLAEAAGVLLRALQQEVKPTTFERANFCVSWKDGVIVDYTKDCPGMPVVHEYQDRAPGRGDRMSVVWFGGGIDTPPGKEFRLAFAVPQSAK